MPSPPTINFNPPELTPSISAAVVASSQNERAEKQSLFRGVLRFHVAKVKFEETKRERRGREVNRGTEVKKAVIKKEEEQDEAGEEENEEDAAEQQPRGEKEKHSDSGTYMQYSS